jgi:hypothetical protein
MILNLDFIGLFICISGFIIGLGAVTVIDIHGFLGRKSAYWTEATIRTHKVTKPLIWVGIFLAMFGGAILYHTEYFSGIPLYHASIACVLILNGTFLSFYVSPFLLKKEREGKEADLLPKSFQNKIIISLVISDIGWWGGLGLLIYYITSH